MLRPKFCLTSPDADGRKLSEAKASTKLPGESPGSFFIQETSYR